MMPIAANNDHTFVQFGYGDVSITPICHSTKKFLMAINLSHLENPVSIGETFESDLSDLTSNQTKNITLEFGRLESLDLLIQQLKLLRGSQADGESLRGQKVLLDPDNSEAEFVRVKGGDINDCLLKFNGGYITRKHHEFAFQNLLAQEYFCDFFSLS